MKVVVGLVLVVVGLLLMLTPGPGIPVFALGVGLVLSQSEPGRRVISRVRLAARRRFGSARVRDVEKRLPRDVIGNADTQQMKLDLEEYERRRRDRRR